MTVLPDLNADLLTKTLDHITADPEGWEQGSWRKVLTDSDQVIKALPSPCGAYMCFAGDAVHLAEPNSYLATPDLLKKVTALKKTDLPLARKLSEECREVLECVIAPPDPTGILATHWVSKDFAQLRGGLQAYPVDEQGHVKVTVMMSSERARELLGLTSLEAGALFHGDNGLEALEGMVDALLTGTRHMALHDLAEQLRGEE